MTKAKQMDRLKIIKADITTLKVDAIVNAANRYLLGGGGVDGAIHEAAGPELLEECRGLRGCRTGEAKITRGYRLPAKWVIHTVGPQWTGGNDHEDELLARCYESCFALARDRQFRTIAFPSISTGVYCFPLERASRIALREISTALATQDFDEVIVACYGFGVYDAYQAEAEVMGQFAKPK